MTNNIYMLLIGFVALCTGIINCESKFPSLKEIQREKRASTQFFSDIENFQPVDGLEITTINDGGPIQRIQQNPNAKNRVEFVEAFITRNQLQIKDGKKVIQAGTGSGTNPETRLYQKGMAGPIEKGFESNDAGHIIANQIGGTGTQTYNIFPQSAHFNRGAWKVEVEQLVYDEVLKNGSAKYIVKLIYENATETRPYEIRYKIEGKTGTVQNDMINPKIRKDDRKILSDLAS